MEPDRKRVARRHTRGVEGNGQHATLAASSLSQIAELIQYGDITIGQLHQIGCVATASDEDRTLAMLVRRKGETLLQLLQRLDQAIQKAQEEDIFTDEINPPVKPPIR